MRHEKFDVLHDEPMLVGECPLWHPVEYALYWVDIDGFAVHRVHPASGKYSKWQMASEPSAIALAFDGLLVATRKGFVHLNTTRGEITHIADAPFDPSTTRFNDGRVDALGRFWVGTLYEPRTSPSAEMYVLECGNVRRAWGGDMTVSNGLAFSPDSTTMYHADTTSHRIDRYRYDLAHGTVSDRTPFKVFPSDKKAPGYGGRPDGAAVDAEGAYWVAMYEGGRVLRFSPDGELLRELHVPVRCPTMVAFGGADLRTLYVTSASGGRPTQELAMYPHSGKVLCLPVDVPGREEPFYKP
ncbi:SMP-30/gluconolactonase/LRE family protein [Pseudoduganella sp. GCM10020061]|uniref:SMP-30/gluconolactonase/LRE family protein n=1 Tax=Pseudoduganella sp. GCM10020061 TaxID=3317345 RepID=UPI0036295D55